MKTTTSTGKKTVRSASTRSTQPETIRWFRNQRKGDLSLIEAQSLQITSQFASIGKLKQKLELAESDAYELRLDVARHEGYISRVREMDGQSQQIKQRLARAVASRTKAGFSAEDLIAMTDKDFEALLEANPTAMDRAMGRIEEDSDD